MGKSALELGKKNTVIFLVGSCFCASVRNKSEFEDVAFRRLLALDHQTLHRGKISVLKENKSTLWDLEEEMSGHGISTIGKCKFTILQNGMVSYTCKDGTLSPECLAYW